MFNRTLQVKMVKPKKEVPLESNTDITYEGKVAIIGYYLNKFAGNVGKAVITYVVFDTLRQVLVAQASNP